MQAKEHSALYARAYRFLNAAKRNPTTDRLAKTSRHNTPGRIQTYWFKAIT